MYGGARGSRTPDLLHAMQTRYQLRYSPTIYSSIIKFFNILKNYFLFAMSEINFIKLNYIELSMLESKMTKVKISTSFKFYNNFNIYAIDDKNYIAQWRNKRF